MKLKSNAKINLALDIIGRDEQSGYHFINTIMTEVSTCYDEIEITLTDELNITIECDSEDVPTDERNTMYQAAVLLQKKYGLTHGCHITLRKNIPIASGLGGGSSNAAIVLKALNQLCKLELTNTQLEQIASQIGIDVPFFIRGGTAYCTHYGECVESLPPLKGYEISINTPKNQNKTSEVFQKINLNDCGRNQEKTQTMYEMIKAGRKESIIPYIHNDFEQIYSDELRPNTYMSGSGAAMFNIDVSPQVL